MSRGTPALRAMGRARTNWPVARAVVRLRRRGWTYRRIGDKFGFSWQRAQQIWQRYGGDA